MAWMLDTNTLSELIKNPQGRVTVRLSKLDSDQVCTSVIVACELRFGAQKRGSGVLIARVEELLSNLSVLPMEAETDRHYADIRCHLENAGTPIGSHDLFIAAHARALGLILVTHNLREFQRIPGLLLDDWLALEPG